jgi:hypothetical protein
LDFALCITPLPLMSLPYRERSAERSAEGAVPDSVAPLSCWSISQERVEFFLFPFVCSVVCSP